MEAEHPLYAPVHGVVGEQLENHKRKTDNFSNLAWACLHASTIFLCRLCLVSPVPDDTNTQRAARPREIQLPLARHQRGVSCGFLDVGMPPEL